MGTMSGWSSPGALEGALKWEWSTATTPSSNTGPSSAHSGDGFLLHGSVWSGAGRRLRALLRWLRLRRRRYSRVTFWYSMYGTTMGTLRLRSDSGAVAWSRSGDQGDGWSAAAAVYLQSASFSFEGVRGSGYVERHGDRRRERGVWGACAGSTTTCPSSITTSRTITTSDSLPEDCHVGDAWQHILAEHRVSVRR